MAPGLAGNRREPKVKQSSDLCLSSDPEKWAVEDQTFNESLANARIKYFEIVQKRIPGMNGTFGEFDTGYQIQRTTPGGFYDWHHDACNSRRLTFIWYLNDINSGGYTEFIDGTKVRPRTGRLLLFPATTQYRHRGVAPKKDIKYIVTGWLYDKLWADPILFNRSGL